MNDYLLEEKILDKLDAVSIVKNKPCGKPLILEAVGAEMRTVPSSVEIAFTLEEIELIQKYIQVPQWVPNAVRPLLKTIRALEIETEKLNLSPAPVEVIAK